MFPAKTVLYRQIPFVLQKYFFFHTLMPARNDEKQSIKQLKQSSVAGDVFGQFTYGGGIHLKLEF